MMLIRMASTLRSHFTFKLRNCRTAFLAFAILWTGTAGLSPAAADLVSPYGGETAPNFAELSVEEDHVRVVLEIDLSDYPFFVTPDDGSGASLADRTGQNFHVEADGIPLNRVVNAIDVRPRISRQTAATNLAAPRPRSEEVVFVDMEFPFHGQPKQITFTPPLNPEGIPLASIGMLAEHIGVPVTDYRYLSRAETMLPAWQDPWFTTFENPNLTRHHKSPLMSFLSMEPRKVRHEIIFRLKDFEEWVDLGLGPSQRLSPEQVAHIKSAAVEFFRDQNPVTIDGNPAQPATVQVSRIEVGAEGLRVLPDQAEAMRKTLLLGVVMSYPHRSLADQVDMTWTLFPDGLDIIPVTLSDPAGAVPSQIYRVDPTVRWNNYLTTWENPQTRPVIVKTAGLTELPIISLGLGLLALLCGVFAWRCKFGRRTALIALTGAFAGAAVVTTQLKHPLPYSAHPTLDEAATHQVVQAVLENVSTALLEPNDDALTTALDPFVDPSHQDDIRAELRRGLSVTLPSGALARTEKILDVQVESYSGGQGKNDHQLLANWKAQVSGGHWGHLHRQAVVYRGLINVSRKGDQWQLDGLTILAAKKEG